MHYGGDANKLGAAVSAAAKEANDESSVVSTVSFPFGLYGLGLRDVASVSPEGIGPTTGRVEAESLPAQLVQEKHLPPLRGIVSLFSSKFTSFIKLSDTL